MSGPYAHITLLHELMSPDRLKSIFSPSSGFISALTTQVPYCSLGAVSPDYPNLVRGDGNASQWADTMHCIRACEMITSGIRRVKVAGGVTRDKQLAWLLGYCAHVATDMTIHPVVQAKVGVYAENQRQHRVCEMNQDSYIYRRMNLGEIGSSDYFAQNIAQCSTSENRSQLDRDISILWKGMLEDVYPEMFLTNPPDCDFWHREFLDIVTGSASNSHRLFPLANVISTKTGLSYPTYDKVDQQFVDVLTVPTERPISLSFDDIFDYAVITVAAVWSMLEQAVDATDSFHLSEFGEWNLDDGCDEHGRLVFWQSID